MPRRIAAPELPGDALSEDWMRRRFRQLEQRLCIATGDDEAAAEAVQAIGLELRRDVESIADPAERLAMAEAAYLSVFSRLPREYGTRSEVVQ